MFSHAVLPPSIRRTDLLDTLFASPVRVPPILIRLPRTSISHFSQRTQREYIVEYLRLHLKIAGAAREGCTEDDRDAIFDAVPTLYR